jgi:AcrR family transcriptional regulator
VKARPTRRTQAERSEEARNKLLAAAVEVLGNRGCIGFTAREAAKLAKLTRGAPQYYFRTTEGFLKAALERLFEELRRSTEQTIARLRAEGGTVPEEDALAALIKEARGYYFGPLFPIVITAVESAGRNNRIRKFVGGLSNRYRVVVEAMWRDLFVTDGFSPQDADDLVTLALTVLCGVAVRATTHYDQAEVERTLELGLQLVRTYMSRLPQHEPV